MEENPNNIEWAITLGIKPEYRKEYKRYKFIKHIEQVFEDIGYDQLMFSIEDYSTTGLHAHVYYNGKPIYWIDFNKRYNLGYVKNKKVYDRNGWIRYISKFNDVHSYGFDIILNKKEDSIISKFTGMSLEDEVKDYNTRMDNLVSFINEESLEEQLSTSETFSLSDID